MREAGFAVDFTWQYRCSPVARKVKNAWSPPDWRYPAFRPWNKSNNKDVELHTLNGKDGDLQLDSRTGMIVRITEWRTWSCDHDHPLTTPVTSDWSRSDYLILFLKMVRTPLESYVQLTRGYHSWFILSFWTECEPQRFKKDVPWHLCVKWEAQALHQSCLTVQAQKWHNCRGCTKWLSWRTCLFAGGSPCTSMAKIQNIWIGTLCSSRAR